MKYRIPFSNVDTGFRKRLVNELVAPRDPTAIQHDRDEMILGLLAVAATLRKLQAQERGEDLDVVREDLVARLALGFDAS